MSYNPYHPPNQPYGHPPPHGYPQHPYPPQPGFGSPPPPQGHYPYPPPGPPHGYGAPPPGPPNGYPPFGGAPGYPPPGAMGAPPGGPPMPYGAPPSMPSPGYNPGQQAPGDYRPQADTLRKAMKGFGTDEKALIAVLSKLDPLQMAAVRATYTQHIGRDLYRDVKSEASGYLRQGLLAVIDGPLQYDATMAHEAIEGIGTKEWLLNDVLVGRSNADLNAIKTAYQTAYRKPLEKDVEGDLSHKTAGLFNAVLRASRHDEHAPIHSQYIEDEARTLHNATAARMVNNVDEFCGIFARSSDNELRAINHAFTDRYHTPLEKHIDSEFSGHMKDALLWMLHSALDPAMRDAVALEECMKGMGTKDEKLIVRVVRVHWNRAHLDQVRRAYKHRFGKELVDRVREETSGDYQKLMVALLE